MKRTILLLGYSCYRQIRWLSVILLCLLIQLWAPNENAPLRAQSSVLNFDLQSQLPAADNTLAVATGDLNGDGSLDLIIGNDGQNIIYLMDGHSAVLKTVLFGGSEQTVDLAVGDLNSDGALDIVVYNVGAPSAIYINDGTGNFFQQHNFPSAATIGDQVSLGDLDGDGDYDLVAARSQGTSTIYQNNGQGSFVELSLLPAGFNPLLLDEDRDNDLDLFLLQRDSNQSGSSLYRFRNNGSGLFMSTRLNLPGGKPFNQRFVAADMDGDGDLDFVMSSIVASGCTGNNCEDLRLLLNQGLLGFTAVQLDNSAAGSLTLADLDNDGDLDIAAAGLAVDTQHPDDRQSKVYLNDTSFTSLQSASFTVINVGSPQIDVRDLAVADLDSDGLLDIVLGNANGNMIYRNHAGQFFDRCETNLLLADPRLMADFNGDSYQDLILQSGLILLNDRAGNFRATISLPLLLERDSLLTTADLNGDGRLDLIAAHQNRPVAIYLQVNNDQFAPAITLDAQSYPVTSIASGDINSDGHLDLVLGRGSSLTAQMPNPGQNLIYLNDGAANFAIGQPFTTIVDDTQDIALGDLDADGDLDIAVANATGSLGQQQGQQNYLYFNDGAGHFSEPQVLGPGTDRTHSIAIGELNGDGHLDLAVGNAGQLSVIYYNDGSGRFVQFQTIGQLPADTDQIILVDLDHDRDLDLITANALQSDAIYINNGLGQFTATPAFPEPSPNARAFIIAAGDLDRDGDIDLVADLQALSLVPELSDCIFSGQRVEPLSSPARLPQLIVTQPSQTVGAGPYASPHLFAQPTIPFSFTLFDPEGKPVDIQAYYSLDGGGQWFPALPTATTVTKNLATRSGTGTITHTFTWDVYTSNFLGHSDFVLLRIEALASRLPMRNGQPGTFVRPYVAAETFPLRVRGTQVRVVNEAGAPVAGAFLYKQSAGATVRADTFPLRNGVPVRTNPLGFIESRGQLNPGDQLVALAPISATHAFTLFHTSAAPTATGLDSFIIQAAGVQTLTVSAAYPLMLFNLRLALEWDARNDGTFLTDLQSAIENASETLFDVTDGQVALGDVTIFQAKDEWDSADVVIYASNSIHPSAVMGGIVMTPTADIGLNGTIPNAYWPGQIRMGSLWDPFGQSEAELRQDWWLAFAHELSHYLLFLPDNYLGIEQGSLRSIDCQGSFMTNTYEETYREFLTRDRWDRQEACWRQSIAAHTTGRADWETVRRFLPWLHVPATADMVNPGPVRLPLQVTRVHIMAPRIPSPTPVLPARNFDLRDASGGEITRLRQAEGYLFKTRGTPALEDDQIIALGSTGAGSDRMKVRGAEPGDRICVIQSDYRTPHVGCEMVTENSTSIRLHPLVGWQPEITVSPVNSTTLEITITQAVSAGVELRVQVLPAHADPAQPSLPVAPWAVLQPVDAGNPQQFHQRVTLDEPVFEGVVRVWVADRQPAHEAITYFYLNAGWGPNTRPTSHANYSVWGPNTRPTSHTNKRAWGAHRRSMEAPVASGDGKVTVFNVADLLGGIDALAIQALPVLPELPLWVTSIGKGYRVIGTTAFTGTIAFHYLEREVPKGYEHTLTIYYRVNDSLPSGDPGWQRLPTFLDTKENLATARMPQHGHDNQGIYALMATVEMPALRPNWNTLAYPIPGERAVSTALASVAGAYTSVYHYNATASSPWTLYDATVVAQHPAFAPIVNDLTTLQFGHVYWLYATQTITPYLAVGATDNINDPITAATTDSQLPPATFYGPIITDDPSILTVGTSMTASVRDTPCGEGQIAQLGDRWVYKIQVAAAQGNGCGSMGEPVKLSVSGNTTVEQPSWDNRQAQYQPLTVTTESQSTSSDADDTHEESDGTSGPYQIFLPLLWR